VKRYARAHQRPDTAYEKGRVLKREIVARWRGRRLEANNPSISEKGKVEAPPRKACRWSHRRGLFPTFEDGHSHP
jgi:hypothetical protein